MAELTEFGKQIKIRLIQMNKQQTWLIEQVAKETGLYFDSSYLYKIMAGKNQNPNVVNALRKILEIEV